MKYIGFYTQYNPIIKRDCSMAAVDKMNYILSSLPNEQNVEVFSCSAAIMSPSLFVKKEKCPINNHATLLFPPSIRVTNGFAKYLNSIWISLCLFFYLIFKCTRKETVIVYHSTGYFFSIILAKYIKNFNLVLEVEEYYGDSTKRVWYDRFIEDKTIETADSYLFASDTLSSIINKDNKPSIVIYGSYCVRPQISTKFSDGVTHVIYAGTFDPKKGGAKASIQAAEFLNEMYHLHICGFGSEEEINTVKKGIEDTSKRCKTKITYEGLLQGDNYISFLQKCDIGLSTQNPVGSYNDTSFPSKIISYMANGLSVVSINIKAVSTSKIGPFISLYNNPEPREIARAIMSVSKITDPRDIISQLDYDFKQRIKGLL